MNGARAHIPNPQAGIGRELALHREVPLHHVIAAGMRLEERLPERIRRDRERRKSRAWKLSGIARACGFKKRRRKQLIHLKQIGQGQDVEDSEAAGN